MLRYLHALAAKDLTLANSMIPLGSCTMKLNATAEMTPVTWPEFGALHPFAPADQTRGYRRLIGDLERMLGELTGFPAVSLQPNAGSQGELTGLLMIRRYLEARGAPERRVCLIPESAHGTNPASAVMAGLEVVVVGCDEQGNVDLADLEAKLERHADRLAALMVTYPSTHGVFEESIVRICELVHARGGQVYMDGANFNAMVGLVPARRLRRRRLPPQPAQDVLHPARRRRPRDGAGGGRGASRAAPAGPSRGGSGRTAERGRGVGGALGQPEHPPDLVDVHHDDGRRRVEARVRRSRSSTPTTWRAQLDDAFPVLFRGRGGRVAHECILDLRPLRRSAGVEVEDVAKRLMDYGFHAPTVSWPVPGTVMVEPTESESKEELDRFCAAMIAIREEARSIERGELPLEGSPLRHAPHPAEDLLAPSWDRPYSARGGRLSSAVDARAQVLAAGVAHRQRLGRSQPGLHLPADRGVRRGLIGRRAPFDLHLP